MKYLSDSPYKMPMVELTRRNLLALLAKLDDGESACTILDPEYNIAVKAVEDAEHYGDRHPGVMLLPSKGEFF